jgi:hypothetical protein
MTWTSGFSGTVNIQVVALGCFGPTDTIIRTVVIHDPLCFITGPDTVSSGATGVSYTGNAGMSGYAWSVTGNATISGSATGQTVLINPGSLCDSSFLLTLTVTDTAGCTSTCNQSVWVTDGSPPTFTVPGAISFCVIDIQLANYLDSTMDITPERPEYYIFHAGDTLLDLDTALFNDNCCTTASIIIHWQIDFNGGDPNPIQGTGQPSDYPTDIQLPGTSDIPYYDVVHTIKYWLEDCEGNLSAQQTRNITIKPRPQVDKIPP